MIATPLLLLLILGIVQFALWEHATHIAQAAAAQGIAVTRLQGGGTAAGTRETDLLLAQLGTGVLTSPTVTTAVSGTQARITITGRAEAVLPFLHLPVRATVTGPLEHFTADGTTP